MGLVSLATLLLIFAAQSTAAPPSVQPTPADAQERMDLAKKVNGLHGMDIPWHVKASFELFEPDGASSEKGEYEEWWVSDKQYRIAFHSPSLSVEEFGTDHGIFRTGAQEWPRAPLSAIRGLIAQPVWPAKTSDKTTFENYQRSLGADKLPCTAIRFRNATNTPQESPSFCFSPRNAILVYSSGNGAIYQTLFQDIRLVHGQYLAYDIKRLLGGKPWLNLQVESLQGLGKADLAGLNVPPGAAAAPIRLYETTAGTEGGELITKRPPAYPDAAKQLGVQGTVIINGVINKEGHLTGLKIITGPKLLQQPALDAVRQWVYKPYTSGGEPVEVETEINVVFALPH